MSYNSDAAIYYHKKHAILLAIRELGDVEITLPNNYTNFKREFTRLQETCHDSGHLFCSEEYGSTKGVCWVCGGKIKNVSKDVFMGIDDISRFLAISWL